MKQTTTELVFILDRSGSMSGMEADTVGGFNSTIQKEKNGEGEVLVSTVLFASDSSVLYDRVPIQEIKPMDVTDFQVGGCTALLDALNDSIHHISNVHKYARKEDVPAHTLFVIMTDGEENASNHTTSEQVKKLIANKQNKDGWEFLFLAANIDAVETARRYGIREENAAGYVNTPESIHANYDATTAAIHSLRVDGVVNPAWKKHLKRSK